MFPNLPLDFSTITDPKDPDGIESIAAVWKALGHMRLEDLRLPVADFEKVSKSLGHPCSNLNPSLLTGSF